MVSDGIEAARIQARYSPLISATWGPVTVQDHVVSALKHAAARLRPHRRRPAGRHAAPGRSFLDRHAPH